MGKGKSNDSRNETECEQQRLKGREDPSPPTPDEEEDDTTEPSAERREKPKRIRQRLKRERRQRQHEDGPSSPSAAPSPSAPSSSADRSAGDGEGRSSGEVEEEVSKGKNASGEENATNGEDPPEETEKSPKDRIKEAFRSDRETWRKERWEAAKVLKESLSEEFSWKQVNVEAFLANEHTRKEEKWGTDYRVDFAGHNRKTPSSSEFLQEAQGEVAKPLFVNTERFLVLPRELVGEIVSDVYGGLTYGETVNVEVAILSYLAGLQKEQPDTTRDLEYDHGRTVTIQDGEFVVSMQKVTRALMQRFFFYPTPRGSSTADDRFHRFYRSAVNAFDWLTETRFLDCHGPAVDTGDRKADAYGRRFSVDISGLSSLPPASAPPSVQTNATGQNPSAGSYDEKFIGAYSKRLENGLEVVDVAAMFDDLTRQHTEQWKSFTEQAVKSRTASRDPNENFRVPARAVKGFEWQRRQARPSTVDRDDEKENSRHVSTGAFKPGRATCEERSRLPCTVPFLLLEIDGQSPRHCLTCAREIVRWLDSINVPLGSVTVSYSGNKSFHLRLPAGLFGNPIFRSATLARRTIREFYVLIEERVDVPSETCLDRSLASPMHHIRAIGSVHEKRYSKGERTMYCVGFTAEQILKFPLSAIQQFSSWYDGYTLPVPGEVPRHEGLHELLMKARCRTQALGGAEENRSDSADIIDRIRREGVAKGEEFAPGLVGRNLAARLLSLNLLQSGHSEWKAWHTVEKWNEKNRPPLGEASGDSAGELRYQFNRAKEDAPHY